ncbi:MAG: ABC transporter permease [Actinomyces ruminicola]|uniref:ABC-2 type transport system permease protein n=1 Tax=Actinomyces ruminicola TaxID=332524 RepID=A0A1G9X834_9ACTO|nr:ABC transporter permease subunit [Actinomyces ruminicola]MBE6480897.1 ABC transporter permease [Actinomyces ruminicola]SDM92888.1 ABC-2 type transport system permease protein [Actinomyces ruminicola]
MSTTALSETISPTPPTNSREQADAASAAQRGDRSPRRADADRPADRSRRQTFGRAVHAEWIKVRSLRSTWITSFIAVGITVLLGAAISIGYASSPELADGAADAVISGDQFGQIVVAVLGALIITGEYSSGQIRSSLAAVPHRGRLLVAKAIVVGVLSFVIGALSTLLAWAASAPFMDGHAASLADPEYLGFVWGTGLSFAGIALMSLGLGFLLRSTAGAITLVMTLMFVIDLPISLMAMKWDWAASLRGFEPLQTAIAVYDPFEHMVTWGQADSVYFLQQWQAVLVFSAWALVPLALGWLVFARRDA